MKLFLIPTCSRQTGRDPLILVQCLVFFFLEVNTFLFFNVCAFPFCYFRRLSSGSVRLWGGFCWKCSGNANSEGAGFHLVGPRPPSKSTEHILVCLITFKLSRRPTAIHCIRHSCSGHYRSIILVCIVLKECKKSNICQFLIFFNIFCFSVLFVRLNAQQ